MLNWKHVLTSVQQSFNDTRINKRKIMKGTLNLSFFLVSLYPLFSLLFHFANTWRCLSSKHFYFRYSYISFLNWLCFVTIFFHLKVIEIYHFFFNTFLGYDASFVLKVRLFVIYYFSYYSPFQWKRIWGYSSKGLVSNQTKIKKQRTSARSALISWCYLCVMRYFTRIRPRERSLLLATIIKRI